ncbi:MAG: hypothetical protein Kow0065_13860 [Methylomicrobium sp.]
MFCNLYSVSSGHAAAYKRFCYATLGLLLSSSLGSAEAAIIAPASVNVVAGQPVTVSLVNAGESIRITRLPANGALIDNGNGTVTYTPNSDYSGADSFGFAADLVGAPVTGSGSVSLNVRPASSSDTPSNQSQVLDVLTKTDDEALSLFLRNYQALDPATQARVLESITPLQTAAQINSASLQANTQVRNLLYRLNEIQQHLRQGQSTGGIKVTANGKPLSLSRLFPAQAASGGAAGDEEEGGLLDNRLGVFVNAQYSRGDRVTTEFEVGSESELFGVTIGMDYRLGDAFIVGGAFGFTDNDTEYQRQAGSLLNRGYSGSLYASYFITDNLYLDGVFTYTGNRYESERLLLIPDANQNLSLQNSKASPKGDQQRFSIGLGYDLPMGPWTFGIKGRTEYGRMNIDAYQEKGMTALNLLVDEQFNESVLTVLGWQVNYAYSAPFGVLLPYVGFDWEHEFKNNSRDMVMRFSNDPSLPFVIKTNTPDRDFFTLRAGMSAVLANGLSSFVQYETLLDQRYETMHSGRIGVRWEF